MELKYFVINDKKRSEKFLVLTEDFEKEEFPENFVFGSNLRIYFPGEALTGNYNSWIFFHNIEPSEVQQDEALEVFRSFTSKLEKDQDFPLSIGVNQIQMHYARSIEKMLQNEKKIESIWNNLSIFNNQNRGVLTLNHISQYHILVNENDSENSSSKKYQGVSIDGKGLKPTTVQALIEGEFWHSDRDKPYLSVYAVPNELPELQRLVRDSASLKLSGIPENGLESFFK